MFAAHAMAQRFYPLYRTSAFPQLLVVPTGTSDIQATNCAQIQHVD